MLYVVCLGFTQRDWFILPVGGDSEVSMGDILSFFTGAEDVPPLGFNDATLNFNDNNPYPTASTCGLILTLPTQYYTSYDAFKVNFIFGVRNNGGFGLQ